MSEFKETRFEYLGHKIERVHYGNKSYLYPSFNGDREFECSKTGFRQLSHFLRFINFINKLATS